MKESGINKAFENLTIGYALTGSFCCVSQSLTALRDLALSGASIIPIVSETVANTDTRFGSADKLLAELEQITGNKVLKSIKEAEPIGPKKLLDILIIAPCTGNTISKIANAVTDSSVTMAAKAHLRNGRPLVIAISTNDGLNANAKNWGTLLNFKNIYFVPFGQDDPINKAASLVSDLTMLTETIDAALKGRQIQPLLYYPTKS